MIEDENLGSIEDENFWNVKIGLNPHEATALLISLYMELPNMTLSPPPPKPSKRFPGPLEAFSERLEKAAQRLFRPLCGHYSLPRSPFLPFPLRTPFLTSSCENNYRPLQSLCSITIISFICRMFP